MAYNMRDDIKEVYFTEEQLHEKVAELGARITEDYRDKNPLIVSVLKGSYVFMADLTRALFLPAQADHRPVRGRQRRYYIRRADADRLHAVRPVHRFSVRQYELYAVGRTRPSGYRAVRAAAGSAAHSPAVSAGCG